MRNLITHASRTKMTVRSAGLLAYVLVLLSSTGFAQNYKTTVPEIRSDSFPISGSELQLSLDGLKAQADSAIGLSIDNKLQTSGSIQIGDFVTVRAPEKPHLLKMMSFAALPGERLKIGKNSIAVSGLEDLQGNLYVLLTVPAAIQVTISVNGKTVFAGVPSKGAVIHGGRLVSQEFFGRHQLVGRLLAPEADMPQPEFSSTAQGLVTSQQKLSEHLISFNLPANDPAHLSEDHVSVFLQIKIGTAGGVIEAKPLSGPEPFVSQAVTAITQARFAPFTLNGTTVEPISYVGITFWKDGRTSSTLK